MAAKVIQNATNQKPTQAQEQVKQSLNVMISSMLDKEGLRKRFDELLGKRTPQFMSSLVSLLNATPALQAELLDPYTLQSLIITGFESIFIFQIIVTPSFYQPCKAHEYWFLGLENFDVVDSFESKKVPQSLMRSGFYEGLPLKLPYKKHFTSLP